MEQGYNAEVSVGFVYAPITTLGYGKRVGVWFSGCCKNCKDCITPEFKRFNYCGITAKQIIEYVVKKLRDEKMDGLTVSGGEPFEQIEFLESLVTETKKYTDDILVYTGYTLESLMDKKDKRVENIIEKIGVIIDGEYIDELNDGKPLRGSSNQKIIILNNALKGKYERLFREKRKTEIITVGKRIISIGIK